MLSTSQLLSNIKTDYPHITTKIGDDFRWSPSESTIYYIDGDDAATYIIHELAHALLKHNDYQSDLELLAMEREAWSMAVNTLAPNYRLNIDTDIVDLSMDSYRDWLHARSQCPKCDSTGLEVSKSNYRCLACSTSWTANEARICRLRRTIK